MGRGEGASIAETLKREVEQSHIRGLHGGELAGDLTVAGKNWNVTFAAAPWARGGGEAMYRYLVGFLLMLCVWVYISRTFQGVMKEVTARRPSGQSRTAVQSRRKCIMCGGTGRTTGFAFGGSSSGQSEVCRSCNGLGWVDNPVFTDVKPPGARR